ncbi:hypothetical protein [Algibacter pacificus]|uniref:hypothetical protein n=1 Tax=Algibacter pacificus TaxID=2599389 RepID=UPI0011CBF14E|nr:hypothetical protein [Algibacter pacificus]
MKDSNFLKDLFSLSVVIVASKLVYDLLENTFSKDDGIINKGSAEILSNSDDKNNILDAAQTSRDNNGEIQNVILSNNKTVRISS